ncbi:MAG: hypothetical protein SGPRY_005557, partial [Prymnesium sp.]
MRTCRMLAARLLSCALLGGVASRGVISLHGCTRDQLNLTALGLNAAGIPHTPCQRTDLKRNDPCASLASAVKLSANATRNGKLYSSRYHALEQEVRTGGKIVELGTQQGDFARFMLLSLKPAEIRVVDLDPRWFKR